MYIAIKQVHLLAVSISLALFLLRGVWMLRGSPILQQRWVRVVPHVNDTVLLGAGVWLAILLRQVPGVS
ncbi:MAG TPA: SirB2 family protein, partial [Burkholderiales bacterium]